MEQDARNKTTYEAPVKKIRVRDQPTFQSSLFTGYDNERRGCGEKRYFQMTQSYYSNGRKSWSQA
jgi:hypothetical protein